MSNLVRFAREFATEKHSTQRYGPDLPYTHHLQAVADLTWQYQWVLDQPAPTEVITAAAWLHDVMEDQGVTRVELEELFGGMVATLVWRVTNESGANRAARHERTFPKIREDPLAVYLKLCDRLANVRQGGPLRNMYRKEHPQFEDALRIYRAHHPLWEALQEAFRRPE